MKGHSQGPGHVIVASARGAQPSRRVLYAPGLTNIDDIAELASSVDRPVNVLMGLAGARLSLANLSAIGVKRVSVGSSLSRAALGAFIRGARELRHHGTCEFAEDAVSYSEINAMFMA